jgi:two-component system chemotaxis response regulator CheB
LGIVVGAVCRGRQKNGKKATPVSLQVSVNSSARQVPVPTAFSVLAIGISTGGPKALSQLIPALPGHFPLPIVLVQHMPALFTKAMADDLNRKSALEVLEAAEGDSVQPGRVLIAPGNRHMVVRHTPKGMIVGINGGQKENGCRPAVDVLFRSVASSYGNRGVLAAIMTGMGSDGTKGVQALKRQGCFCLTQSKASCVVYGMPQIVDSMGLSDESVNLNQFAERLTALATNGRRR